MARRRETRERSLCRASGNYYKPQLLYQPQGSYHIRGELLRALVNRADTGDRVSSRPLGVDPGYRRGASGQHPTAARQFARVRSPAHRVGCNDERRCHQLVLRVVHGAPTGKTANVSKDLATERSTTARSSLQHQLHPFTGIARRRPLRARFWQRGAHRQKPNGARSAQKDWPITARAFGLLTAMLDPPCPSTGTRTPSRRAQTQEGKPQFRARPRSPIAPRTGCSP